MRTNEDWLRALQSQGEEQAAAIADLRAFLLRAVLYSFHRSQSSLSQLAFRELEQTAEDCAQDALLEILEHLSEFRGDSKFTTWAFKFAVNFSLTATRRASWKHVSLDEWLDDTDLPERPLPDENPAVDPDRAALQDEIWAVVHEVIDQELTQRQRQVLKAIVFDEVPMDELVRHLGTNRNAIYKQLHDARLKLKAHLEARGFGAHEVWQVWAKR